MKRLTHMGLLFALQPNKRRSREDLLFLHTSKKRVGLGMGLMLGGFFLGTMFYAALPLFEKFLEEGAFFDKAIAAFFYAVTFAYPLLAFLCFSYEQVTTLKKTIGGFELETFQRMLFFKWAHYKTCINNLSELEVTNWKGALNTAALEADKHGKTDRYATKGHWMLQTKAQKDRKPIVFERRARRDDIEWLQMQIESHFNPVNKSI